MQDRQNDQHHADTTKTQQNQVVRDSIKKQSDEQQRLDRLSKPKAK